MTEKELIKKIRELRQIKPRKDWVVLTKEQIFSNEPEENLAPFWTVFPRFIFQFKLGFATLTVFGILAGAFTLARNSLPGDLLYSLKKISENTRAFFVSEEERPQLNLEFANKRLEELNKIAENNEVKKLAPAINEFQTNISQAAKNLVKLKKVNKEIVAEAKKIEENKDRAEKALATKIETKEYDNVLSQLVESQIKDIEKGSLTEEQKEVLEEAKKDLEGGDYSEALAKILILSQK